MPTEFERAKQYLAGLETRVKLGDLGALEMPTEETLTTAARVVGGARADLTAVKKRWAILPEKSASRDTLLNGVGENEAGAVAGNIENFIGIARIPVGLAGPLRVRGLHARGDYYIPLATTEAALVASYARGCQVISEAGGCTAAVLNEAVGRSPAFKFGNLRECGKFVIWLTARMDDLRREAEATTRWGKLVNVKVAMEGNHVFLLMEYSTGDAAGQNMVTIATEAACRWVVDQSPVKPRHWFIEGNMSGDKKASTQSFQSVRGKKVTAEAVIPAEIVRRRLHCEVADMLAYYRTQTMGAVMSGTLGIQGHFANGLAAMFIACGQDAACVAESATGVTRMEEQGNDLYVSVTLPSLIVGTIGGGTGLPTQKACLDLMGLAGEGKSCALAEVCGGLMMAGELSITGAMASGHFTRAHRKLARGKKT